MAAYSVRVKRSAAKELDEIGSKKDRQRIVRKIRDLANDPRPAGVEKLSGTRAIYRLRQGSYRIVYEIRDEILLVHVVRIGHRKAVYRKLFE